VPTVNNAKIKKYYKESLLFRLSGHMHFQEEWYLILTEANNEEIGREHTTLRG
jgi:hypothetical protein